MNYAVYILRSSKDDNLYVGCTSDLKKRLELHNSGKVFSTRNRYPFRLIYTEIYLDKNDAFVREKFLKTGWGRNYVKRVLKNYFFKSKNLGG